MEGNNFDFDSSGPSSVVRSCRSGWPGGAWILTNNVITFDLIELSRANGRQEPLKVGQLEQQLKLTIEQWIRYRCIQYQWPWRHCRGWKEEDVQATNNQIYSGFEDREWEWQGRHSSFYRIHWPHGFHVNAGAKTRVDVCMRFYSPLALRKLHKLKREIRIGNWKSRLWCRNCTRWRITMDVTTRAHRKMVVNAQWRR